MTKNSKRPLFNGENYLRFLLTKNLLPTSVFRAGAAVNLLVSPQHQSKELISLFSKCQSLKLNHQQYFPRIKCNNIYSCNPYGSPRFDNKLHNFTNVRIDKFIVIEHKIHIRDLSITRCRNKIIFLFLNRS